ncbi:unnamed protein product [Rotaria sp. Silwood2]|nr:unnamed protein product [Rotaria sp. Silwood2]
MCRLDYSPLGRKLENVDGGFKAYCGFIQMEANHRHPVMLAFTSIVLTHIKIKQGCSPLSTEKSSSIKVRQCNVSSRAIRKWHLTVLLIRNPSLIFQRKDVLGRIPLKLAHITNNFSFGHSYDDSFDARRNTILRNKYVNNLSTPSNQSEIISTLF